MPEQTKMALYTYKGRPTSWYTVEEVDLAGTPELPAPSPTHHVLLVDRSGSMYPVLESTKSILEKVMVLEEFKGLPMRVTLISYSSDGDVTEHFARVPVEEVMAPNSREVASLRAMQVTGLTCISQALELAKKHVVPGEVCAVSLHSDGYANDKSPASERRKILALVDELVSCPGVFVNTIAYSSYADFPLLAAVANRGGGSVVQASTVHDVYEALHDTSSLLARGVVPRLTIDRKGSDFVVWFSVADRKVLSVDASSEGLSVYGVSEEGGEDQRAFRFTRVSEAMWEATDLPVADESDVDIVVAFAAAKLAQGHIRESKLAMVTTRLKALIGAHYRALTPPSLAAFHRALLWTLDPRHTAAQSPEYGLGFDDLPLTEVLALLQRDASYLTLDLSEVWEIYQRRGLSRKQGSWTEDGQLVPPRVESRLLGDSQFATVENVAFNNANATVNLLVSRPMEIIDTYGDVQGEPGEPITEICGVQLTGLLKQYNNFTIVGDGELCLPRLCLKITHKATFRQLRKWGLIREEGDFSPLVFYTVDLSRCSPVSFDDLAVEPDIAGMVRQMARMKSLAKMLSALLSGRSARFDGEMIAELATAHLTPTLNFSPPTTTPYFDMAAAESMGFIDHRVSYSIDIGHRELLSLKHLLSGNKLFERFVEASILGAKLSKPKMTLWWDKSVGFTEKALSSRVKITPIDEIMRPILFDFLGLSDSGALSQALLDAGIVPDEEGLYEELGRAMNHELDDEDAIEVFTKVKDVLEAAIDHGYSHIRDLVFYVGTTGMLPESIDAKAMTAEEVRAACPKLKIGPDEAEGTFFVRGDMVISVYATDVRFSV